MRRLVYILLALAFVGCHSDEIAVDMAQICFETNVVSRAALSQSNIESGKVFVCGVQNNSNKIFNNVAITRDATTGKWFASTKRNWTEGSNYSFHAYAYNTASGLTLASGKDGLEFTIQQPSTFEVAGPGRK